MKVKVKGYNDEAFQWTRVYIVGILSYLDRSAAGQALEKVPAKLVVKVWR